MQVGTLILGAGAAGMMCAAQIGNDCLVIDHARAPGEKIRISGGGRCNFTNLGCEPDRFLGENPHFHKSALARYTQWDFIDLVSRHGIAWHEKTLGQLFCDHSAREIIAMLRAEMGAADLWLETALRDLRHDGTFVATLDRQGQRVEIRAKRLVVATGGKSIPKMGASGLAYDIARQFGHRVTDTRPGLVPLTFPDGRFRAISGVSVPSVVRAGDAAFEEALLFTHRGLSGPSVLQASSYWREGAPIEVDLLPGSDLAGSLRTRRKEAGRRALATELARHLPQKLVAHLADEFDLSGRLGDLSDNRIDEIELALRTWTLRPAGSEGYRTAEVTLGGIGTEGLSSKTMESRHMPGLHFVGEAVDVTGWLGGYNFQWAWSSGWAAGQAIAAAA
ncbi:BaiN/RdsA family NAD(P)/FAD-dependent oxidoreductase [Roseivivax sediminis]|uniref:Flavoprotein, HI0933 family n=1 Tax=Roseivivax sediminis TaxID=936889 RepID=A0A1I1SIZ5_9RHOB|nr:aminoacetone oxidase family FAD-binding enzyme [Roseivivax sediminis]SFD46434.1 hypothetical protein SAMN04515678_101190 [Roseivivax sediminis]